MIKREERSTEDPRSMRKMTIEEVEQHEKLLDDLEAAIGSYCEVRELNNMLAILGNLERVEREKGAITVRPSDRQMPPVIFNTDFKLMIRPRGGIPLVLNGKICGSSQEIWKLDCLSRYFYKESRNYFRQPTNTTALATCINELFHPVPEAQHVPIKQARACRVMDVSLQGLQLRGNGEHFKEGDLVIITDLVLVPEQRRHHNFICRVRRVQAAGRGEYLFGCQFEDLSEQQQDTLCSDIFVLHRLDIQASRLG